MKNFKLFSMLFMLSSGLILCTKNLECQSDNYSEINDYVMQYIANSKASDEQSKNWQDLIQRNGTSAKTSFARTITNPNSTQESLVVSANATMTNNNNIITISTDISETMRKQAATQEHAEYLKYLENLKRRSSTESDDYTTCRHGFNTSVEVENDRYLKSTSITECTTTMPADLFKNALKFAMERLAITEKN